MFKIINLPLKLYSNLEFDLCRKHLFLQRNCHLYLGYRVRYFVKRITFCTFILVLIIIFLKSLDSLSSNQGMEYLDRIYGLKYGSLKLYYLS